MTDNALQGARRIPIKTIDTTRRREVNISEWNPDVKAFVRDITGLERKTFLNQLAQFYDKALSADEQYEAGLCACIMVLVDEEGVPLFSLDQIGELKAASSAPVDRTLALLCDVDAEDESLKKA